MKKLSVNPEELGMANYYLDKETGEIIMISDETGRLLEQLLEEAYDPEASEDPPIEEIVAQAAVPDWQRDALIEAYRVEAGYGERYVAVESDVPWVGYHDMEAFIETVEDDDIQERLWRAISGRGAFRYFKDVLYDYPAECQRWFAFKEERLHERVVEWLEEEGIEPLR